MTAADICVGGGALIGLALGLFVASKYDKVYPDPARNMRSFYKWNVVWLLIACGGMMFGVLLAFLIGALPEVPGAPICKLIAFPNC
ncbi:MAG TPA: hypothetical protein VH575_20120 [Gemmataceae bacterium]